MTAILPIRAAGQGDDGAGPDLSPVDDIAVPEERRTPMQSALWLRACYDSLYWADTPRLLAVEGAFGPFVRKGRAVPRLYLAGSEELAEPIEPPCADDAAAERLTDAILAERMPVRFGHIPADGPFAIMFRQRAARRGVVLSAPVPGSPYVTLDETWRDPMARISKRRRSDFRRMRKRADAMGAVRFEFLSPGPSEVAGLLDAAAEVEARSWKGRHGTAIAQNPQQTAFLARFGQLAAAQGLMRVAFLHIGDRIAAMQIAAEWGGSVWLFKIGYDEAFAKASPGMLLMMECVRRAAEEGLTRVEFLGKAAGWTDFWCDGERPNLSLRFYPRSPVGMAALAADGARIAQGRIARKLRGLRGGGTA